MTIAQGIITKGVNLWYFPPLSEMTALLSFDISGFLLPFPKSSTWGFLIGSLFSHLALGLPPPTTYTYINY